MRSRLAAMIGGILGASFAAFVCGAIVTLIVIVPMWESRSPGTGITPSPVVGPRIDVTSLPVSPTPTRSLVTSSPTPTETSTAEPEATATTEASATATSTPRVVPPSPTPPRFPFYYVEGSRIEQMQCAHPYLQGWVRDASGAPLNGVWIRWDHWQTSDYAVSGDLEQLWQEGEFKFTYGYGQKGFNPNIATDFVLQVVTGEDNPQPLSEALVIHYSSCNTMGQITNIVFKHR